MSYKLSGINPLAYMGVEPSTPPQMVVETRPPTINDNNFNLGTYWLIAAPPPTTDWELWILVDLSQGIATWKQLFPGSGGGGADQFDEDTGIAVPALGVILVKGGENINTVGDNVNKITINLNESIHLPNTSADGSQGVLFLGSTGGVGGSTFLHNYGTGNTFVGNLAGNLTLTVVSATDNSGFGNLALSGLTTGATNTAMGSISLDSLTSGSGNCAFGASSLSSLTTTSANSAFGLLSLSSLVSGTNNIAFGFQAGLNYTSSESNNILIGNPGVVSESNTIRIGVEATQTSAFMAGVYNQSVGATNAQVFIDNTGKLGTMESGQTGSVIVTTFLTSGTWTKNPNTKMVEFYIWSGGSGGGGGSVTTTTDSGGGGGGAGGNFTLYKMFPSFCGASEPITIGAGGSGGAAITSSAGNTNGNNGSIGGITIVGINNYNPGISGTSVSGHSQPFGTGGGNFISGGGWAPFGTDYVSFPSSGSQGGNGNTGNGAGAVTNLGILPQGTSTGPSGILSPYIPGSGGGGAGTASASAHTGGSGTTISSQDWVLSGTVLYPGASGGGPDANGTVGISAPTSGCMFVAGGGGGGGGGAVSVKGGNGGNGSVPGGGGGGGGGSKTNIGTKTSGAGGNGGNGAVIVVEYL